MNIKLKSNRKNKKFIKIICIKNKRSLMKIMY